MQNNGQQIITCKQCGSNKVQDMGGKGALIGGGLLGIGLGIWIPVIGWFIMIPAGLIMLAIGLFSLFFKTTHRRFKCRECKYEFNVPIETYKEYKAYLQ
jgi:predicted nucleic-acid-binding Zn-ribbon protein